MEKKDIKQLLQKQIDGRIDKADLSVLKSILQKENEEALEYSLEQLWEEFRVDGQRHSSFDFYFIINHIGFIAR